VHKEIVVNDTPAETRIAILEDHKLVEVMAEAGEGGRIVGDIYKGRVGAVLPGMQAAFIDIGMEKSAFLHVSDMRDMVGSLVGADGLEVEDGKRPDAPSAPIQDLLKKGQEIVVQVTKEPISTKGPRVTSQISIPGRFMVLVPYSGTVGVSRKIESTEERDRLKEIAREVRPPWGGFIVRTVAEGASKRQIKRDAKYLTKLWRRVHADAEKAVAPSLVHREMGLTAGLVRDIFSSDVDRLIIDSRKGYKEIAAYIRMVAPELKSRLELHKDSAPIFDDLGIETEIEKTFRRKVYFKKGGYIVIDHTEALISVDVNTGRYTGKKNQEETILRTNLEAAREIGRQLRLRDIGGIVVIDFIDMQSESNRNKVVQELKRILSRDRARSKVFPIGELGLVRMTRQRVRPTLLHLYSDACPCCDGTGKVPSLDATMLAIERSVRRIVTTRRDRKLDLEVSPEIAVHILTEKDSRLRQLERETNHPIEIRDNDDFDREEFRILSSRTGKELVSEVRND